MQGGFRKFLGCRPFHLVLGTQPLSQPLTSVSFNSSIGFADWPEIEVVSPSNHHVVEFRYHGCSASVRRLAWRPDRIKLCWIERPLSSVCLDVLECLAIYSRCSAV